MRDFARSDNPVVQRQLDRIAQLSIQHGRLSLDTIRTLLGRLGDPHKRLPPTFHVAGTNGKGSTCAFLRAILEADGKRVHVSTSPHLVRYNERIRIAGELISDDRLGTLLTEVLDAAEGLHVSFFEVTIAAVFTEFARVPADVCVIEVGLGGRLDATNVIEQPVACGIAALGMDHEQFLLAEEQGTPDEPLARIAFEKAGIAKSGCSLVTLAYPTEAELEIERAAARNGAPLSMRGRDWHSSVTGTGLHYADRHGELDLPLPSLRGTHQAENAALAIAMLRHQDHVNVSDQAITSGVRSADWPARLQRLAAGPLTGDRVVWLDGGHNPNAGAMLGNHFAGERLHLVVGMLENKNPRSLVDPLAKSIASIIAVPVPGHDWHNADAFGAGASSAANVSAALAALPDDGLPVLISGSLYLAGEVLRLNEQIPD